MDHGSKWKPKTARIQEERKSNSFFVTPVYQTTKWDVSSARAGLWSYQCSPSASGQDLWLQHLTRCCCEMSASASRRDNTDRSLARSAWESVPRKNRPVGYGMIGRS